MYKGRLPDSCEGQCGAASECRYFNHSVELKRGTHPEGCLVPVSLAQQLCAEGSGNTCHGPPAVHKLGLLEALQVGRGGAQTKGVKSE